MADARNTREVGDRVEHLLADLAAVADPAVAEKAEQLARTLMELYGAGLARIVELVAAEPEGEALVRTLADDGFVASLLVLHDLHPVPVADRVQAALEKVRPYLGSHAGGVEFLGIDDAGVARLALQGSCDGCPSSTVTVKLAIEQAIEAAAPELAGIEVAGVVAEEPAGPRLLQIQSRRPSDAAEWFPLPELAGVGAGQARAMDVAGVRLAVCKVDERFYAYRDACASCGASLDGARLTGTVVSCPTCQSQFDVQAAGRVVGGNGAGTPRHLDPVPLVGGAVALPVGARS